MSKKLISIIVPVHNEVAGLSSFLEDQLLSALEKIENYDFEIIFVDDGSTDGTLDLLYEYASRSKKFRVISFSRNFGKEMALSAGLRYAKGDAAITVDADGQQPPKLIPTFIKEWEAGADIVTGVRDHYTKHGFVAKTGSRLFYWLLRRMGNHYTVAGSTDFRLISRPVIDEFNKLPEHNRITRGLIDWLGFDQKYVKYTYGARLAGKPSYNLKKLFRLAIDSFVSMSTTPLVIFGYIGIIITLLSGALGLFCLINQYVLGDPLHFYWPGTLQMAILITFLVGLVLISQAVTALYISSIHAESLGRPLYIVDQKKSRNL
ncbi:glycosyltransferase family 2 protein [Candidatus Saccharibacteria bacterium]|nr:glycosyltransferase family 2 protein [Candidatus Saccharibacteria bacterium]